MRRSRSLRTLAFDFYPAVRASHPAKSVVFLHGILGTKRNWRTPAKAFQRLRPDYAALAFDHPGHGGSIDRDAVAREGPPDLDKCAEDLLHLLHFGGSSSQAQGQQKGKENIQLQPPTILCGHSFGGKVALKYLQQCQRLRLPLPQFTWILDSIPAKYDLQLDAQDKNQSVSHVFRILHEAPRTFASRDKALEYLQARGISLAIAQWLVSSINSDSSPSQSPPSSEVELGFDMTAVQHMFEDFVQTDLFDAVEAFQPPPLPPVDDSGTAQHVPKIFFVRAGRNHMWTPEILARFQQIERNNPRVRLLTMPHVGHWLHVEDCLGLLQLIHSHSPES